MDHNTLIELLNSFKKDNISIDEVLESLKTLPFKDMDFAKIDTHRNIRQGFSEAVYCPGKKPEQIIAIMQELKKNNSIVLATRADKDIVEKVLKGLPEASYDEDSKIITLGKFPETATKNYALVITAGTVDIPVAKEALITLKANGIKTKELFDCGIAGPQRLFKHTDLINKATAIIVIAGMEGALASLVGGISSCPVIAVPTSKGYGANFNGLAPLLSMLNSCTSCVSVVNIDNGYSAGTIASLILKQSKEETI